MPIEVGVIQKNPQIVNVEWEIKDYFSHNEEDICLLSPEFFVNDTRLKLCVYPNGYKNDKDYVKLYLLKCGTDRKYHIPYKMGILKLLKCNGSMFDEQIILIRYDEYKTNILVPDFCPVSRKVALKNDITINGSIKFICTITYIRFPTAGISYETLKLESKSD